MGFAAKDGNHQPRPAVTGQVEPCEAVMQAQNFERTGHACHQTTNDLRAHDDALERQAQMICKSGTGACNADIETGTCPVKPDATCDTGENGNDRTAVKPRACQKPVELCFGWNAHGHHTTRSRVANDIIEHEQPKKQEGVVENQ